MRQSLSYLNIVYKIKFSEPLKPIIQYPIDQILIGEPLIINASSSYSLNVSNDNDKQNGLEYQWGCNDIFKANCDKQQGRKLLIVSYDDFMNAKGTFG